MEEKKVGNPVDDVPPEIPGRLEYVPVDACVPNPDNVNVEDVGRFNDLVDSVRRNGVIAPITVRDDGEAGYLIIAGEHRWKAAKVVGLKVIPALVTEGDRWKDSDEVDIESVALNQIHGRFDPEKFTKKWEQLRRRYSEQYLKRRMGFASQESQLRKLLKDMTQGLPEEARVDLEKRAEKIKSVEDLAAVVQALWSRYGGTLNNHFMLFSFGGKTHLMVKASPQSFEPVRELALKCNEHGVPVDEVLAELAREGIGIVERMGKVEEVIEEAIVGEEAEEAVEVDS